MSDPDGYLSYCGQGFTCWPQCPAECPYQAFMPAHWIYPVVDDWIWITPLLRPLNELSTRQLAEALEELENASIMMALPYRKLALVAKRRYKAELGRRRRTARLCRMGVHKVEFQKYDREVPL